MFGLLIGSFFFGWFSDAVGRVPSLVAAGLTLLVSQGRLSVAFTNNNHSTKCGFRKFFIY